MQNQMEGAEGVVLMDGKPGWIKLHRKIQDCFLWDEKPYDKARAWIDLLLSVAYHDKKTGDIVKVSKGSFVTSAAKLSERWGWSRNKVNAFLKMLEDEQMVYTRKTTRGTTVTIVNYEKYQVQDTTENKGATKSTTKDTTESITEGATKNTSVTIANYGEYPVSGTTKSETKSTAKGVTENTAKGAQLKKLKNNKNIYKNIAHLDTAAEELFDKLWVLYPAKKGKGQVSLSAKKRLLKVGYDEMARAIDRYKAELEKDSNWRKPQYGSTFFNNGYIDYLDANYVPDEKTVVKKKGINQFNSFQQRDYNSADLNSIEQRLLSRQ